MVINGNVLQSYTAQNNYTLLIKTIIDTSKILRYEQQRCKTCENYTFVTILFNLFINQSNIYNN